MSNVKVHYTSEYLHTQTPGPWPEDPEHDAQMKEKI